MSPESTQPILLDLPVREVVIAEDRTSVCRRGTVVLGAEPIHAVLTGLSPVLVDASLTATLRPGGTAQVAVRRRWETPQRLSETEWHELALKLQDLEDQKQAAAAAISRAEARRNTIQTELGLYSSLAARAAVRGLGDAARWGADLRSLETRLHDSTTELCTLRARGVEIQRQIERWSNLRISTLPVRPIASAELVLHGPAGEAELELRYLVPAALWRPSYEATLSPGPTPQVRWQVQGTVWQRTGEDWRDVSVTLSTARSSAGSSLPPLHEDRLQLRTKTPEERKTIQADFRDQSVASTRLAEGAGPEALPGVDDGGEPLVLRSARPIDLPSDGRPHRVDVRSFEAPARLRQVCIPERDTAVFREVTLENRASQPLLAGPVVLVLDGAYAGVAEIPFVGPGELFPVSFGSLDDIVVRHVREQKVEKRKLLSDLTWFVERAELFSTAARPVEIELRFREPVSELAQVKIVRSEEHTTRGGEPPDASGHLRFRVTLDPGQRLEVQHGFRLEKDSGVQLSDPW